MSLADAVARLFAVAILAIGAVGFWAFITNGAAGVLKWIRRSAEDLELWLTRPRLPEGHAVAELPPVDAERTQVPVLMILPLLGSSASEPDASALGAIGLALSRLAIRQLMLRADLSVRGPEDTPAAGVAAAEQLPAAMRAAQHVLGGSLERKGVDYIAQIWLSSPNGEVLRAELTSPALPDVVDELAATAALWIGSTHSGEQPHREALRRVTPAGEAGFVALGTALLGTERSYDELEADEILLSALDRGPELSLLAAQLSRYHLHVKIRAHDAAPCDAQLCYSIARDIWSSGLELGSARAYLLKALELSACHARANAIAFRMAADAKLHGRRAALGYALAPGSSFAAHQYALFLMRHGGPDDEAVRVARELVAIEPSDPVGLWALMTAYEHSGDRARAIESGERLLQWMDPLDPRAERQLRADRELCDRLDEGWSLAAEIKERLGALRQAHAAA